MIIGPALISLILPLQLYAHNLQNWHPQSDSFIHIACDSAGLIGLPSLMNKVPLVNHNPELQLRSAIKEDEPPKRRKYFIRKLISEFSSVSNFIYREQYL